MIHYRKGSLFSAPQGSMLVHACNAQGVWGAGIASQFRRQFPAEHRVYKGICMAYKPRKLVGKAFILNSGGGYMVTCLFTSADYGNRKDSPSQILNATEVALKELAEKMDTVGHTVEIHSPMFNAGLFKVPWKQTEALVKEFCIKTGRTWNVWKL